jgi:hypothetical protein
MDTTDFGRRERRWIFYFGALCGFFACLLLESALFWLWR